MLDPVYRNYDVAFPKEIRDKIRKRRKHPTGELHSVKTEERDDDVVQVYPWKKMELGDFFLAKVGSRSPKAMKTTFMKAAQRNDFELSIKRKLDLDGDDAFEVTLTMFEISVWRKRAARDHNVDVVVHDRSHAKKKRRHNEAQRPKRSHKKRHKSGEDVSTLGNINP